MSAPAYRQVNSAESHTLGSLSQSLPAHAWAWHGEESKRSAITTARLESSGFGRLAVFAGDHPATQFLPHWVRAMHHPDVARGHGGYQILQLIVLQHPGSNAF